MHNTVKRAYYFSAVAIAAVVFYLYYDFSILWPENINWLLSARHDWGQHYLGWAFFRNEPWYFPLGTIKDFVYPVSTNIGFTDSIPLLAIPLKLLSPFLPDDFQYIGLWLFLCYVMTAFYSLKIFRLYAVKPAPAILATLIITANPVLWFRAMHPALCAHGFIIASIYLYLKPATKENTYRINRSQIILTGITSLVHPYLFAMVIGFNIILPLKHYFEKILPLKKAIIYPVLCCAIALSAWFIVGLIKIGSSESLAVGNSYGLYVFNLNSLYNSSGFSSLIPPLATDGTPFSYESFMYLGAGMGLLVVILIFQALISGKWRLIFRKNKFLYPLLVLAVCMALFAITNRVIFNDKVLFEIPLPQTLLQIGSIFRASSRFFWMPYYLILFFFLLFFLKQKINREATVIILLSVTALQAYDLKPLIYNRSLPGGTYDTPLSDAKWNSIIKDFDRMITYPPFDNHLLDNMDYQDLGFLAIKNDIAISTGYTARDNVGANKQYMDSLTSILESGKMRKNELYVTTAGHLETFSALLHNKTATLEYLDGYYLVYSKQGRPPYLTHTSKAKRKIDSITRLYSQTGIIKKLETIKFDDKITWNAEDVSFNGGVLRIRGWAFHKNNAIPGDSIFVTLSERGRHFLIRTTKVQRPDVAASYKRQTGNLGFKATAFTEELNLSDFIIGIAIKSATGEWTHARIGPVKEMVNPVPQKIYNLPPTLNQKGNIDNIYEQRGDIFVNGWSAFMDKDATGTTIKLVLSGEKGNYQVSTRSTIRRDVTMAFQDKYNFDNSGFELKLAEKDLPQGEYRLGILIIDRKNKQSYLRTDKTIEIIKKSIHEL